jgi:hypothetical protein
VVNNKIVAKVHKYNGEIVLAACDQHLLDKNFEEGELQLTIHSSFYNGFEINENDLIQHLKESTSANLVGQGVIDCVRSAGLISEDCILTIQGIPHAQIYRITT